MRRTFFANFTKRLTILAPNGTIRYLSAPLINASNSQQKVENNFETFLKQLNAQTSHEDLSSFAKKHRDHEAATKIYSQAIKINSGALLEVLLKNNLVFDPDLLRAAIQDHKLQAIEAIVDCLISYLFKNPDSKEQILELCQDSLIPLAEQVSKKTLNKLFDVLIYCSNALSSEIKSQFVSIVLRQMKLGNIKHLDVLRFFLTNDQFSLITRSEMEKTYSENQYKEIVTKVLPSYVDDPDLFFVKSSNFLDYVKFNNKEVHKTLQGRKNFFEGVEELGKQALREAVLKDDADLVTLLLLKGATLPSEILGLAFEHRKLNAANSLLQFFQTCLLQPQPQALDSQGYFEKRFNIPRIPKAEVLELCRDALVPAQKTQGVEKELKQLSSILGLDVVNQEARQFVK